MAARSPRGQGEPQVSGGSLILEELPTLHAGSLCLQGLILFQNYEHKVDHTAAQDEFVEANLEVAKWIWESGFAALAEDALNWECTPSGKRTLEW